jgi:hypothetical protein
MSRASAPPPSGKSRAGAGRGSAKPAAGGERADRPDEVESVAGEEDPGSALEQFSDLMHDTPADSDAGPAESIEQPTGARRASPASQPDAGPQAEPRRDADPDRRT